MSESGEKTFENFQFSNQLDLVDSHDIGAYLMLLRLMPYFDITKEEYHEKVVNLHQIIETRDFDTRIKEDIEHVVEILYDKISEEEDLTEEEIGRLINIAKDWQGSIKEDLDAQTRIPIEDEGFFDVKKAIEHPEKLFESEIWDSMPKMTRKDIREACRSLAVNCPTGSVFLSLRAVEDRLRFWYQEETGNEIKQETWGHVLDKLEEHYSGGDNKPEVLSNLRFLKEKRNQISHPDHSPTRSEAETTLIQVKGTITEIYKQVDIEDEKEETKETGLPEKEGQKYIFDKKGDSKKKIKLEDIDFASLTEGEEDLDREENGED